MEYNHNLIKILSAGLRGDKVELELSKDDIVKLYIDSKHHRLSSIIGSTLVDSGIEVPDKWKNEIDRRKYEDIQFNFEYEALLSWLEQNKIWYMPLKGAVLNKYWPKRYMRERHDIDILFDSKYAEKVRGYFVARGYEVESYGTYNHDVYIKRPIMVFEMHKSLLHESHENYEYYEDIESFLMPVDGNLFEKRFLNEDFYIFLIIHGHKHYTSGGVGYRSLADIYLFLNSNTTMNRKYIENELFRLNLLSYEKKMRELAYKLFDNKSNELELSDEEVKMIAYINDSGSYGEYNNKINHSENRLKLLMERIFPGKAFFKAYYKNYKPWLLPVYWLLRVFRGVFLRPKRNFTQLWLIIRKRGKK